MNHEMSSFRKDGSSKMNAANSSENKKNKDIKKDRKAVLKATKDMFEEMFDKNEKSSSRMEDKIVTMGKNLGNEFKENIREMTRALIGNIPKHEVTRKTLIDERFPANGKENTKEQENEKEETEEKEEEVEVVKRTEQQ